MPMTLLRDNDDSKEEDFDKQKEQHELALKLSSRDAVIETLERVARDNVCQMVKMEEEMRKMREALKANGIDY